MRMVWEAVGRLKWESAALVPRGRSIRQSIYPLVLAARMRVVRHPRTGTMRSMERTNARTSSSVVSKLHTQRTMSRASSHT